MCVQKCVYMCISHFFLSGVLIVMPNVTATTAGDAAAGEETDLKWQSPTEVY